MAGWVAGTHHARTRPRSRFDSAAAGPPSNNACIPPPSRYSSRNSIGAWLSLVERLVRDQEVAGSNPVAPTPFCLRFRRLFYCFDNGILWGICPILGVFGLRKGDKLGGQNPFAPKNTMLPPREGRRPVSAPSSCAASACQIKQLSAPRFPPAHFAELPSDVAVSGDSSKSNQEA